jgi:hypothetical protein
MFPFTNNTSEEKVVKVTELDGMSESGALGKGTSAVARSQIIASVVDVCVINQLFRVKGPSKSVSALVQPVFRRNEIAKWLGITAISCLLEMEH